MEDSGVQRQTTSVKYYSGGYEYLRRCCGQFKSSQLDISTARILGEDQPLTVNDSNMDECLARERGAVSERPWGGVEGKGKKTGRDGSLEQKIDPVAHATKCYTTNLEPCNHRMSILYIYSLQPELVDSGCKEEAVRYLGGRGPDKQHTSNLIGAFNVHYRDFTHFIGASVWGLNSTSHH